MQAPHRPQAIDVTNDQIVYCPACNLNLFAPLFVYAVTKTEVIDAPAILSQSLTAIKCGGCGQIIPLSQVSEFTSEKLKQAADQAKEALNAKANDAEATEQLPADHTEDKSC